jgi:hypothetical protein
MMASVSKINHSRLKTWLVYIILVLPKLIRQNVSGLIKHQNKECLQHGHESSRKVGYFECHPYRLIQNTVITSITKIRRGSRDILSVCCGYSADTIKHKWKGDHYRQHLDK